MTSSPSMDILISSILERLLFEISNRKDELTKELVNNLKIDKKYSISPAMKENLKDFYGGFANEKKVEESIGQLFKTTDYLIDTHTSVAYSVYKDYREKLQDDTKTLIALLPAPLNLVLVWQGPWYRRTEDDFEILYELAKLSHLEIPKIYKT